MRVNNRIIANSFLQDLQRNLGNLSQVQEKMSSGKQVSKPSDDPAGVAQILSYKTIMAEQDQHIKNMEDGQSWLDLSEGALNNATAVLQRARELAVYGANGTLPNDSSEALAQEAEQLVEELVQVANTVFGDRYVFGGSKTNQLPFSIKNGEVVYSGDETAMNWEMAPGVTIQVNADGYSVFHHGVVDPTLQNDGSPSMFQALYDLAQNLRLGKAGDSIVTIDAEIDHLLGQRAIMGAKSNRLQLARERMENDQINTSQLRSRLEDVDLAKASIDYTIQSNVYRAALQTGAKIIQPTLLDFLR